MMTIMMTMMMMMMMLMMMMTVMMVFDSFRHVVYHFITQSSFLSQSTETN